MESCSKQKWEDLNLSRDELKTIGEALQKEEFRSLLLEYVKEISDPENRKQYEKEITQLENERGVDIKFIHPSSGYVIKTSVNGESKAFINVCTNDNVGKPSSARDVDGLHEGLRWSIPYCLAPPREDVDKKGNSCLVYDVVFHPDTLHLTNNNSAFKNLVNSTALEAVEENFNVSLDKINLKYPKIQFKGNKHATVIRRKIQNFQADELIELPNYPYPPVEDDFKSNPNHQPDHNKHNNEKTNFTQVPKYVTPKYSIKHRSTIDMQNYTNDPLSKMTITVPNDLVIVIDLPLLKHSTDASIDVTDNTLILISEKPAKYKLNLRLPYVVDSNRGNAKFDIVKKTLTVTLPVVKQKLYPNVDSGREDSGVESDNCYGRSNSISSSDEEGIENEVLIDSNEFVPENENAQYNSTANKFLNSNIHYVLPNFSCRLIRSTLNFTLQVPNVNPDSVEYCFLNNSSGFHLTFSTMGTGFFPVNYAMFVLLPIKTQIEGETFNVEVWDNNVVAQVSLISSNLYASNSEYYVGTDKSNLKKYVLPKKEENEYSEQEELTLVKVVEEPSENLLSKEDSSNVTNVEVEESTEVSILKEMSDYNEVDSKYLNCQPIDFQLEEKHKNPLSSTEDNKQKAVSKRLLLEDKDVFVSESSSSFDESTSSPTHRQHSKSRTVSESHQSDIKNMQNRGILKIGRSLSESNMDDYTSWPGEKMEKTKKTVRFSEIISKQTFRMNSSILGQRKKNQRKTRNKKRAQERRLSESGNESEGENDIAIIKENRPSNNKEIDIWFKEPESSSCDVSEVSEVSDISESDDSQKEEGKPSMPCSSKKNHKRRGKKSARKNAATAKLQFMEN